MNEDSPISQKVLAAYIEFLASISAVADQPQAVLKLCDRVRDDVMPFLGVRFEDDAYMKGVSVWKLDSIASILRDREKRRIDLCEGKRKKLEKERQKQEAARKKAELAAIPPSEFFKVHPTWAGKFGSYDDDGMPLTTIDGKELSKGMVKKTGQAMDKHKKAQTKANCRFCSTR